MGKFSKLRKQYKKRKYQKKRKMSGQKLVVNKAIQPIPQRYICKMKYSADVSTNASGQYLFNLNSTFDPDRSGIGHQPYGRDTLAVLYNRYRVISCGWRITAPSSSTVVQCGVVPANEVITITSMDYVRENPRAKYFCQNPGGQALVLKGKVHMPSLVGRTTAQYMADDRYQALAGADPNELAILNIFTANSGGSALTAPLNVLLEYTVEWFDVNTLQQS